MSTLQQQREAHYAAVAARAAAACSPVDIPADTPTPTTYTELERAQRTLRFGSNSLRGGGSIVLSVPNLEKLR